MALSSFPIRQYEEFPGPSSPFCFLTLEREDHSLLIGENWENLLQQIIGENWNNLVQQIADSGSIFVEDDYSLTVKIWSNSKSKKESVVGYQKRYPDGSTVTCFTASSFNQNVPSDPSIRYFSWAIEQMEGQSPELVIAYNKSEEAELLRSSDKICTERKSILSQISREMQYIMDFCAESSNDI